MPLTAENVIQPKRTINHLSGHNQCIRVVKLALYYSCTLTNDTYLANTHKPDFLYFLVSISNTHMYGCYATEDKIVILVI